MGFLGDLFKGVAGAIPVAGPLIQGALGGLMTRDENRANRQAADLYNQFYGPGGQREQAANALVDRLSAAGYDPFGPQTSSGTNWGQGTTDQTTRFSNQLRQVVDPSQRAGYQALNEQVFGRLGQPTVTEGEKLRQIAATNAAYQNALQGAQDVAGMRGQGALQRAAGTMGVSAQRAGDIADYLASVPELERQRQFQNEQAAQGLIEMMKGRNESGVSRTTGTDFKTGGSTTTGGPNMGFLADLFMPQGPMAPTQTGVNPLLAGASDVVGGLTQLFANKQKPQQQIQQLPAARNYTSSVFGG